MIFHCEDHMSTKLMIYCPMTFAKLMQQTLLQSSSICEGSPVQFAALMHQSLPKIIKPLIKNIYKKTIGLPKAFILPKGKKFYQSARPVITYHDSPYREIFRAGARIMSDLATEVYQDIQFAIKTPLEAFRILKTVDMNNIKLTNQDLVGFFTSVHQERILDGVHRTIQLYCSRSGAKMYDSLQNKHQQSASTNYQDKCQAAAQDGYESASDPSFGNMGS